MTQDNSRLDRLEAAIDNQFADNQFALNAELRTSVETLNNASESQRLEAAELRSAVESVLQIVQLHQQDIQLLATEFRDHRSGGYGA